MRKYAQIFEVICSKTINLYVIYIIIITSRALKKHELNKNNGFFCLIFHKNCIRYHYFIMYFRFASSISSIFIIYIIRSWSVFDKKWNKETQCLHESSTWCMVYVCMFACLFVCTRDWWSKSEGVNDRILLREYLNGWFGCVFMCGMWFVCLTN